VRIEKRSQKEFNVLWVFGRKREEKPRTREKSQEEEKCLAVEFDSSIKVRVRLLYNNIGYISDSDSTWVLVEFWGKIVNVMIWDENG